jgi:hypothetical protein
MKDRFLGEWMAIRCYWELLRGDLWLWWHGRPFVLCCICKRNWVSQIEVHGRCDMEMCNRCWEDPDSYESEFEENSGGSTWDFNEE